jgi:hypothetical protein
VKDLLFDGAAGIVGNSRLGQHNGPRELPGHEIKPRGAQLGEEMPEKRLIYC